MLKNNKLLIDKNCPMCQLYGKCFTSWNWVDKNTVISYQQADQSILNKIGQVKAKSEIAFHNVKTGYTHYGINAIIRIISQGNSTAYKLFTFPPFYFVLKILYFFISYNRKIIAPTHINPNERDCSPKVHRGYISAYIIISAIITGFILNYFSQSLFSLLGIQHSVGLEYLIALGQIIWQGIFIHFLSKKQTLPYLGNMSTVSLIGSLLLIPVLLIQSIIPFSAIFHLTSFALIIGVMIFEHIRRCKLLNLSLWMTASWVGYRTFILFILLQVII